MPKSEIKIGTFGYRSVGKSTYLTTLYSFLLNRVYKNVSFTFGDNNSSKILSDYLDDVMDEYSQNGDFSMKPTSVNLSELNFKINRKDINQDLIFVEHRGEATVLSQMADDQELFDVLAGTDGIIIFYSNYDAETSESKRAYQIKRQRDLTFLLNRLKDRLGTSKINKPFVLVLTKTDAIEIEIASQDNTSLIELLDEFVSDFRVVGVSSKQAFSAFYNENLKLTESARKNEPFIFANIDIAYPLFWLMDTINEDYDRKNPPLPPPPPPLPPSPKKTLWWNKIFPLILIILGSWFTFSLFRYGYFNLFTFQTLFTLFITVPVILSSLIVFWDSQTIYNAISNYYDFVGYKARTVKNKYWSAFYLILAYPKLHYPSINNTGWSNGIAVGLGSYSYITILTLLGVLLTVAYFVVSIMIGLIIVGGIIWLIFGRN